MISGFASLYVALGAVSMSTNYVQTNTATLWLPSGFAIGLLLVRGVWLWPAVTLGSFVLNVVLNILSQRTVPIPIGVAVALCISVGNTSEALLGCYLTRRYAEGERFLSRARNVFAFALTASVAPPAVSAVFGVVASRLGGFATPYETFDVALTWYLANALGIVIFVGPTLALFQRDGRLFQKVQKPFEAAALVCVLAFVTQTMSGLFTSRFLVEWPRSYMVIPALLWAAFRFGTGGALLSIVFVTTLSAIGTMRGFEAFPARDPSNSLIFLQVFLSLLSVTTLSICAGLTELAELRADLENRVRSRTREIQHLLRSREVFTSLVAHDLQSPLYGVRNALRAAAKAIESDQMTRAELASAMTLMDQACSEVAARITKHLAPENLNNSTVKSGKTETLSAIVSRIEASHRLLFLKNRCGLRWEGNTNIEVRCPAEVEHIIDNLISNALKFGPKGSPLLIRSFKHRDTIEVHITDRGAGVVAEERSLLFTADMRTARAGEGGDGGGLGLYLASEQTHDLGGRLSYLHSGTYSSTFRLILPA